MSAYRALIGLRPFPHVDRLAVHRPRAAGERRSSHAMRVRTVLRGPAGHREGRAGDGRAADGAGTGRMVVP